MLPGLYSAATALSAAELNQEVIAQNLAHLDVPGYRRRIVSFETFENALEASLDPNASQTGLGTQVDAVETDFSPGAIRHSGRKLDVALSGDAFFVLAGPEGPLYTRNGAFHLSASGELVSGDGLQVQGSSGPLTVPAGTSPSQIHIDPEGYVSAAGTQIGQLQIVAFGDNTALQPAGTSTFEAPAGVSPETAEVTVAQGARELSNVAAVDELIRMIVGMRYHENSQRAMTTISEAIGQNTDPTG